VSPPRERAIAAICLPDTAAAATKKDVLDFLNRVEPSRRKTLIVAPFLPFLSFAEGREASDLGEFSALARKKRAVLVLALAEKAKNGKTYHSAILLGPDGSVLGKYRQSHKLAWDGDFALGDDLPVFDTPFGRVGAAIGSDFYFPEVFEVLRMRGAEVLLWLDYPERLREHFQWIPLLFARAFDSHAFLVTAQYADPRTYITNNYAIGMRGAAFGRSMIIDRSGTIRADSGYRDGVAAAVVDLDERKLDVYPMTPNFENLFYVPNNGGRAAFQPLAEPWRKPALPAFAKRTARIAVASTSAGEMWADGSPPRAILELLDRAAELKPDLVLFSENSIRRPEDPAVRRGMEDISAWAARHRCYVAVGGLGGPEYPHGAVRVWDRRGKIIYTEPLYWQSGAESLEVFDTDFARVAAHSCGDLFQFPIDRVLALKGAELILDPSQMWGPDGAHNELLLRARAVDNACYLACAHWNTSDPGLRSVIVDPYGGLLASSGYQQRGVVFADIDFAREKVFYSGLSPKPPRAEASDIPSYFTPDLPAEFPGWRDMVFGNRRPELYGLIPQDNDVTRRYVDKRLPKK
jgi:predicted amidohydrolase